jgi:photosystem II stability/assembly factor-like uncharacterized protein
MMSARSLAAMSLVAFVVGSPVAARAQGFNAVTSKDGADVWAVGNAGVVYRSLNGGTSWGVNPLGNAHHRGVAARGTRVWIVDADGTLWTSEDTGYSFSTRTPAGGTALYAVSFASDSVGWIAGGAGKVLKTEDAGQTWSPQVSNTTASLFAIRFRDPLEGWACGTGGTVLHTTDGGSNWIAATPFAFKLDLYGIDYRGGTVWVVGTYSFCARSDDAGGNWTSVDLKITSKSDVDGVALRPDGSIWLCGGGGFMRGSGDAGATWFFPKHNIVTGLTDVFFYDDLHGWACAGRSNNVMRTVDGGTTWTVPGGGAFTHSWVLKQSYIVRYNDANRITIIRGNTLRIDPVNRNKLWCVQGRFVMASWDLGETWSVVDTIPAPGSECNAFVVSATDTNVWLALMQAGDRVVRRTALHVWAPTLILPFTEYGLPLEQDVNNPDHVIFAPETTLTLVGTQHLWQSFDFGQTWSQMPSNTLFRSPDDIVVVSDTTGVMYVGDGVTGGGIAQLFKSSDGGVNWSLRATGPSSETPMMASSRLDRDVGYATFWSTGGVLRSQDMGTNWTSVSPTVAAWGVDIPKDDPNCVVFAVYSGSISQVSLDRGATWNIGSIVGANYGVLAYDRGTYFIHQSNGICKSVITQPDMPVDNAQTLTLLVPNGGEVWRYGETDSIRWSSYNMADARLEYQAKPAGPWAEIVPSVSRTGGLYAWPIPSTATFSARVRISDALDGSPLDTSDAPFSIVVPALAASPAALAFGDVDIGTTRTDTLQIQNLGSSTLVVSSVTLAHGGPYTPDRTSFSIEPGLSDTVLVVFEPPAIQPYDDTLLVASNAPGSPARVPITGNGHENVAVGDEGPPVRFALRSNAPNPFGTSGTLISYTLPQACDVRLEIFSVLGQRVATLVRGRQPAGRYAVRFPAVGQIVSGGYSGALPSGVYFCRLKAGDFAASRRMVMIR